MTIEEFLQEIIKVFEKVGVASPKAEAYLLACHVLSCDLSYLMLHPNEELDDKVLLASAALINERCKGRPIQYVIGSANFYGVDFAVDERVLIPRPETESLVELAINELEGNPAPAVLDLCTGSGCIAAIMAINFPKARIVATELSPKAFMLARVNLRPFENVKVLRGDLFEALNAEPEGERVFDAILTNPPYIKSADIKGLSKEVKDYEPKMALDGGKDGLDIVRRIIDEAPNHIKPGGLLLIEIGDEQGNEVLSIVESYASYESAEIVKDLTGKDRILKAILR